MGNSFVNGSVVEGQSCHEASARPFAAMRPSGVAAHQCARAVFSLLHLVVSPAHGGFFHSSSSNQASTSQARAQQRISKLCTACSAHSSSVIKASLGSLSMTRFGQPADL